jgi:predicted amidohydrolase YtcJ
MKKILAALAFAFGAHAGIAAEKSAAPVYADAIYSGGDIVTMTDMPAEALAVSGATILAVGSRDSLLRSHRGPATRMIDLEGRALLPGFVDAHSHFSNALQVVGWANVSSPPVGPVTDIPGLVAELKQHAAKRALRKDQWLIAYGYDQTLLRDQRDLAAADLDTAFPDMPVLVTHVSAHGVVLNSAAMRLLQIDENTPTPAGGVIARIPGSNRPAGLFMENALGLVYPKLPHMSDTDKLAALDAAQMEYARNGYTTVSEGATPYKDFVLLRRAAGQGLLFLDMVSLPVFSDVALYRQHRVDLADTAYHQRLKIGGVKVMADGSPQGRTAYWTEPLLTSGPEGEPNWRGAPMLPYEQFAPLVRDLVAHNIRVNCHANGDAAIDMLIKALRAAGVKAEQDRRDEVIHSQFVRADQLDSYAELGVTPSFFAAHTFFWGDVHVANTGEKRAFFISPLKAASDRKLHFSNHTDFTVTPLDPMMTIWSAVARESRSGRIIGPAQRVDAFTALKAITLDAAWQYREERTKGSLEAGKLADLVVLSANPLKVEPAELRSIRVVETIKEGKPVFRLSGNDERQKGG